MAIFLPALYGGGAERVMLNLAAGLAARQHAVDLVVAQAEGPYLAEIPSSVRLMELNPRHRRSFRTLASLPALIRYLRRERPDALISALHANIVALWARRLAGSPRQAVVSEHNTLSVQMQTWPRWHSQLMLRLIRSCYPWADAVTAVSAGVADDLAIVTGIPRSGVQVIYNPIVTPQFQEKATEPLVHPWFEPGSPPVVLGVGRLAVQKDFGTLIRAFARVRQTRSCRLLILGEGEERPALEAVVRELGMEQEASLPGFVPNPFPYMAQAALFVLSSRWEGLPTVLVEALYCGSRIVATECPSGPREILCEGRYGQLVPVGDVGALARAMEDALAGKLDRPPAESWRLYELDTVVDQYVNLLSGY